MLLKYQLLCDYLIQPYCVLVLAACWHIQPFSWKFDVERFSGEFLYPLFWFHFLYYVKIFIYIVHCIIPFL